MVKWVIDHLNIEEKTFKYLKGENIGSFKVEYLQAMYHLPSPWQKYDKAFVQGFRKNNLDLMKVIKEWKEDQGKLKRDKLST